ncbi:MAG TPA: hypothetical protein VJT67_13300 [Longimicrobiaceae bacterium]|nr:hypothetical protein [Longimicrobiaceae bacterium]
MQTQTVKERVRQAVEELPDDATFLEALERVYDLARHEGGYDEGGDDTADEEEIVTEFSASTISATMTTRLRRASARAGSPA